MKLTKFSHSLVRLEKDGAALVIDPGSLSEAAEALRSTDVVLVTHEHADHVDLPVLAQALTEQPELQVYAPESVAASLRELVQQAGSQAVDRVHTAETGTTFEAAGFHLRVVGGQHALIHPRIPVVANLGYIVDGAVYHPGDSLIVPAGLELQVLLVPLHAPWSKTGEVVDFVCSVRAAKAYPIHDALLNEAGRQFAAGHVSRFGAEFGTDFQTLALRETVEI
ncbi:MBL fold metallo-hydrolase [Psychromicrobium xiongbiense]|uniref:MBL fold metallo-hydrolase n=1 Tax=Psychromicrobium xiongbiense TaxID=3051184 RepID=UPI002554D67F|nr:MBL fold metallo-hydrolase [Psychromicrobium sp. YIM S02556]